MPHAAPAGAEVALALSRHTQIVRPQVQQATFFLIIVAPRNAKIEAGADAVDAEGLGVADCARPA